MHRDHLAVFILVAASAFDDVTVAKACHVAREQAAETLLRHFLEVFAFDPQLTREGHRALAEFLVQRVVRGVTLFDLAFRIVVDDQLERIEHGDAALVGFVHHFAHRVFKQHVIDQRVVFGNTDAFGEQAETFGRVAAPAGADQRRHARVVPAVDVLFVDQLDQLALGQHDVGQVEAREFDLLRQRALQQATFGEAFEQPVVERALVFEFERADRMGDAFERILDRVREGVHRVDAILVAGVVMGGVADAVDRRIAQVDVGRRHVDLCPQDMRAVGELASLHALEQVDVLGYRAGTER